MEDICIEDIALSLSRQPRFLGHTHKFYSVAQHSVLCAFYANKEQKLDALLHDASEAYMGDLPKPLKHHLPDYNYIEKQIQYTIKQIWNVSFNDHIECIDLRVLHTEMRDLTNIKFEPTIFPPFEEIITPWSMGKSYSKFMSAFYVYGGSNG